jgi:hypothetical protein
VCRVYHYAQPNSGGGANEEKRRCGLGFSARSSIIVCVTSFFGTAAAVGVDSDPETLIVEREGRFDKVEWIDGERGDVEALEKEAGTDRAVFEKGAGWPERRLLVVGVLEALWGIDPAVRGKGDAADFFEAPAIGDKDGSGDGEEELPDVKPWRRLCVKPKRVLVADGDDEDVVDGTQE